MHGLMTLGLLIAGLWGLVVMANALRTGRIPMRSNAPVTRKDRPAAFWTAFYLVGGASLLMVGLAARSVLRVWSHL